MGGESDSAGRPLGERQSAGSTLLQKEDGGSEAGDGGGQLQANQLICSGSRGETASITTTTTTTATATAAQVSTPKLLSCANAI